MNWRVKGIIQKSLSAVPGGVWANDYLQRTVGGLRNFTKNVDAKVVNDWAVLAGHMTELGVSLQGLRYFEIGTGWFPTLPLCFALAGAESCVTFDLSRHISPKLTSRMLERLGTHLSTISKAGQYPLTTVEAKYREFKAAPNLSKLFERANIEYRAPADATESGLPDESVDVVFSNSVLEHVPRTAIVGLMQESQRVLRIGGLAIHSVNCGDHYAYFDRNITFINYLTYSTCDWQFWNNDLQFQNRLRPQDFLELASATSLEIVLKRHKPRPNLLAQLSNLPIALEFQRYSPEQLCCTSVDFVAQKQ